MDSLNDAVILETVRDRWLKVTEMEGGDFPDSNQGATMDLVTKMQSLTETKGGPNIDNGIVRN